MDDRELQHEYYTRTARNYNVMHVSEGDEHFLALSVMVGLMDFLKAGSVLDVGSGTGRALSYIKAMRPSVKVVGVEPVKAMRDIGHEAGLAHHELVDGRAEALSFSSKSLDVVCAFGVLHHVPRPELAVAEMLRVARLAIFISDSNNFGQGSFAARTTKQILNLLKLWPMAVWAKTHGRRFDYSEGDGVSYSYSAFNNYSQIKAAAKAVHVLNTSRNGGASAYRSASHVAMIGLL